MLGVCLGHQGIGIAFGGEVIRAPQLMHGKTSSVQHDGRGVFRGVSQPFVAGRYHSLIVGEPLPAELEAAARTEDGTIMGVRHREYPIHGVQFHPESVLTGEGKQLLRNFLEMGMMAHVNSQRPTSNSQRKSLAAAGKGARTSHQPSTPRFARLPWELEVGNWELTCSVSSWRSCCGART